MAKTLKFFAIVCQCALKIMLRVLLFTGLLPIVGDTTEMMDRVLLRSQKVLASGWQKSKIKAN